MLFPNILDPFFADYLRSLSCPSFKQKLNHHSKGLKFWILLVYSSWPIKGLLVLKEDTFSMWKMYHSVTGYKLVAADTNDDRPAAALCEFNLSIFQVELIVYTSTLTENHLHGFLCLNVPNVNWIVLLSFSRVQHLVWTHFSFILSVQNQPSWVYQYNLQMPC